MQLNPLYLRAKLSLFRPEKNQNFGPIIFENTFVLYCLFKSIPFKFR